MKKKKRLLITDVLESSGPPPKTLLDSLRDEDLVWACSDCGNKYGPEVDSCPNRLLDTLGVRGHLS